MLPGRKEGKGQETEEKAGRTVRLFWPNLQYGGEREGHIREKKRLRGCVASCKEGWMMIV